MSYSLLAALTTMFKNDATLVGLLGTSADGSPSVHPTHYRDVQDVAFPLVSLSRIGSGMKDNMFGEVDIFSTTMDNPRIVICVFDKKNIDRCYGAYRRIDQLLRGSPPTDTIPSHYMVNFKMRRRQLRDDLFDRETNTYYIYSEYETWVMNNPSNEIPIPS